MVRVEPKQGTSRFLGETAATVETRVIDHKKEAPNANAVSRLHKLCDLAELQREACRL